MGLLQLKCFPQLKTLNFSGNRFNHLFDPIHGYKSFQRLENLENIDLSSNDFNNSVLPFLSGARSLRILNLQSNSLEGVFCLNGLNNFRELEELDLQYNYITDFEAGEDRFASSDPKLALASDSKLQAFTRSSLKQHKNIPTTNLLGWECFSLSLALLGINKHLLGVLA
ncbi:unnamed protein product [Microthlaspi erraticum]|uniref:Leucine-rich repeat-containing N-terminal plant-type domain-containing protein n=1 Tax=Microthlaspi erraticum TaxID=1685480 RepID=A0A6D2J4Q0_9BRAS|nr:unnamed protein product [Microthlaspi erraticum]